LRVIQAYASQLMQDPSRSKRFKHMYPIKVKGGSSENNKE